MKEIVFDIEVYPDWWCIVYSDPDYTNVGVIQSTDKDYMTKIQDIRIAICLIGFNIKRYDLRILNAIINGADPKTVSEVSESIIKDEEFKFNDYSFWNKFNFSDLYDDWMYGSLKEFESNSGMSIMECPVPFGKKNLTESDIEQIVFYCKHDVEATCRLLKARREYVDAKITLAEMFNLNLSQSLKSTVAKLSSKILGAKKFIYEDPPFFEIKNQSVKKYIEDVVPKSILSMFTYLDDDNKEAYCFDNQVVYGKGGIHSVISGNAFSKTSDEYELINIDGANYYPMLLINFEYLSRSVPNSDTYKDLVKFNRKLKSSVKQELETNGETLLYYNLFKKRNAIKLILNATYGAMKNQYNELFDPYRATSMCYLGQLLLTALAIRLHDIGVTIIQTNTDGILTKTPKSVKTQMMAIVSEWENLTGIDMEYEKIAIFFQKDVNNYIEVKSDGMFKLKGRWTNQAKAQLSNLNAPITHKALVNYYIKNIPIEETIRSCKNPIEFCFTAKTGYTYDKTYYYINDQAVSANKVNRVYATTNTMYGTLKKYKRDEDRYDKISEIPAHCMLMNDDIYFPEDLDIDWYIEFTNRKLKELIEV